MRLPSLVRGLRLQRPLSASAPSDGTSDEDSNGAAGEGAGGAQRVGPARRKLREKRKGEKVGDLEEF